MCADSMKPAAILSNWRITKFLILKSKLILEKKKSTICCFLQIHSECSEIRHRLCCWACTVWKLSGRADSCHKSMGENFQYMLPFGCRIWLYKTESSLPHTSIPCITSGTISAATCGNTYITSCSLIIAVIRWVNYKLETNKWVKIILCLDSKNLLLLFFLTGKISRVCWGVVLVDNL